MGALEGIWWARIVQEEGQGWVAQGCSFLQRAEQVDRRGIQRWAMGGLGLLHTHVLEKLQFMQQFALEATEIKQTHIQRGRDIWAQALCQVLHMETQGRDRVSFASQTIHNLTLTLIAQRNAMLQEESLHRRMFCAAARRHLTRVAPAVEHPPPYERSGAVPDRGVCSAHFEGTARFGATIDDNSRTARALRICSTHFWGLPSNVSTQTLKKVTLHLRSGGTTLGTPPPPRGEPEW